MISAADEGFMPLARGLVQSLLAWQPRPFDALGFFDLGLSQASRSWLAGHGAELVTPGWDLPVADDLRARQPHLRALTVRPFLPRHFPGHAVYAWIDADAWVQERFALDWLLGAGRQTLAIVPELDRAYRPYASVANWRLQRLARSFGPAAAQLGSWQMYFNAGVLAAPADAPHWAAWARHFGAALQATQGQLVCDQTALNHALWVDELPRHPLPARCNWVCHLGPPVYDAAQRKFLEPVAPHAPIGLLQLTGSTKTLRVQVLGQPGASIGLQHGAAIEAPETP